MDAILKRFSRIDVLVNNAGDLVERRPLREMSEDLWRQVIDLNLTSTFFVSQAAAAGMVSRKRGTIVNMASLAAHNGGGPGALAYAAAKGGIISLTKAMAKELAPHGVRVNCVAPGLIGETQFHARYTSPEVFEAAARSVPLGRAGTPEEVARVIAFLAGPDSAYLRLARGPGLGDAGRGGPGRRLRHLWPARPHPCLCPRPGGPGGAVHLRRPVFAGLLD